MSLFIFITIFVCVYDYVSVHNYMYIARPCNYMNVRARVFVHNICRYTLTYTVHLN